MRYYIINDKPNETVMLIKRPNFGFICKFIDDELYDVVVTDTAHIMRILILKHKNNTYLTEYELIFKYNKELTQIYKKICDDNFDTSIYENYGNENEVAKSIKDELERLLI